MPMLTEQNDIPAVLKQFWERHAGDTPLRGRMVVGVSGGADSLALLHGLKTTTAVSTQQLTAVYVNHGLRPEAPQEAQFVTNIAQAWGIAVQVRPVDVDTAVLTNHSLEEAARLLRYRALVACAREVGANAILVAHTADDQAETVLMHLLRGSGLRGLRGMRPISPLPRSLSDGRGPLWVVRPMLAVWRKDIEAYCLHEGLTPVEDASNQDTAYFRNA
ncbi:MAG: tRNA lysidine(34) synthetase TilS, partial [Anaerolineales bacterium]|nr:tRNA lysidine(34) synthetase TilS [Anaerolineales bacterium]